MDSILFDLSVRSVVQWPNTNNRFFTVRFYGSVSYPVVENGQSIIYCSILRFGQLSSGLQRTIDCLLFDLTAWSDRAGVRWAVAWRAGCINYGARGRLAGAWLTVKQSD